MNRLLLTPLLLLLACADPYRDLSDDEAQAALTQAAEAGDTDRYLDILKSRAEQADLWAIGALAEAYERGQIPVPPGAHVAAADLAVRAYPWDAPLWRRRFEAAVQRGVETGDPEALLYHAWTLTSHEFEGGDLIEPDPILRDSGRAILRSLAEAGDDRAMLSLGFQSPKPFGQQEADPESYAWFRRAAAAGNPQACAILIWKDGISRYTLSADTLALAVERARACDRLAERDPVRYATYLSQRSQNAAVEPIRQLRRQAQAGNAQADSLLDALDQLGVFERHPDLAAVAP